ncbi:unnamed protein product [Rotaria sp. Silwood1]|nr:unnamed protein product [Rotaria sp. Silwood1]
MHNQLSLPLDRKLQNSLILSMKSSIEERIRQSSIVILQLLYTHFHHDHHEQQLQRRRSSIPSLDISSPILQKSKKPIDDINNINANTTNNNNNSTVKVSALVAHYSNGDITALSSSANNHNLINLQCERAPTFCFYCKEKVSIQDWFVVEKNVLHVKCFKCDTCHLQLRKTNYQVLIEPNTGKISFHCRYHNLNKQQKVDYNKKKKKKKRFLYLHVFFSIG